MEEDHSSRPRIGIQVFTNPLEMESFFSEQFDEILKQFGFGQFSGIIFGLHLLIQRLEQAALAE